MLSAPRECKEGPSESLFDLLLSLTNRAYVHLSSFQPRLPSPFHPHVSWMDYCSSL